MIHSILLVQYTCLTVLFHNLSPGPLWSFSSLVLSTSYSIITSPNWLSSFHKTWIKRIPEIIITRFYRPGVLPVAQSTESKHWKECKTKIPTREKCPLDLVISDPSIDSWYRWCCTFYAGTSTLVLKIQYPVHNWQLSCYLYGLCHFLAILCSFSFSFGPYFLHAALQYRVRQQVNPKFLL